MADHKLDRVFVAPTNFYEIGPNQVRVLRMNFQAPAGTGLYTFQTYIKNDSYVGTDAQKDMKVSQTNDNQIIALILELVAGRRVIGRFKG